MTATARGSLSGRVVTVTAHMRPRDLQRDPSRPSIYAVFDEDPGGGRGTTFLGLVTDADPVSLPGRIFADLIPRPSPPAVRADAELEDVLRDMDEARAEALPVIDESGAFLGVVTRSGLLAARLQSQAGQLEQSRLQCVDSERRVVELGAGIDHLQDLNSSYRRLLALLAKSTETRALLREGIEILAALLQARYAAAAILNKEGRQDDFVFAGMSDAQAEEIGGLPQGHGLLGLVIEAGQALIVDDISRHPRAVGLPPRHPPMKTLLAVPIVKGGRIFGRVYLSEKKSGEPFSQEDAVLAAGFAQTISSMLAHARELAERNRAERELRGRTEQLQAINDAMVAFLERGEWREATALILRAALSQTDSEFGFLGVVVDGPVLRILAHEGIEWDAAVNREFYERALRGYREAGYLEFTSFDNLFGSVITGRRSVLSNDPSADPRAAGLPRGHPPLRCFLGAPMLKREEVVGMIAVANRPDGYSAAERDQLEVLAHLASVLYDSYRRHERELSLEHQLRQSQKMEAIGKLAGGVAHDFNNMLTVILGHCEILRRRLAKDGGPHRKGIEGIRGAAERAASLTRQLLAFSRRQVLDPKVLDLNRIATALAPMLRRLIGEDIRVRTVLAPDLWHVRTDPGQIEQVIVNLIVNARDAMPGGGEVTIETTNVTLDQLYADRHVGARVGDFAMLAVSDSGHGMSPEVAARAFEPFFTTKEVGKGTGLGLSTVYGIVKQSGGNIWAYSEPGRGSTFKIYLPRVDEEVAAPRARAGRSGRPQRGTETVLLAEDEGCVRALIGDTLRSIGYTVLEARNGREALQLCRRHAGAIHLLLTDVVMPEIAGPALARQVAALRPEVKVLFMSGYTGDSIARQGVLDVGVSFIQKPFSSDLLIRRVREALEGRPASPVQG
ncbi:MAG: GAF domain-containing protein [Acidobacteriota bacterium]